ncbi:hypothetical protein H206_06299 [Candidatus Electrothrix aarhusensis]|uniref:Uncharacterized protein n=1 Tax=Candidatus Electrothrix aarhusensis TaxID=1859131 RepID=A0A3S4TCC3_9BACT|nr:hypothetical protein H206_06299 [Candidatus Electrothrix aarhusensis]
MNISSFKPILYFTLVNFETVELPAAKSVTLDSVTVGIPSISSTLVASTMRYSLPFLSRYTPLTGRKVFLSICTV